MLLKKIETAFAGRKPLGACAVHIAKIGKCPTASSLHPNAFVGCINVTGAVKTGVNSTVFPVHRIIQPKITALRKLCTHGALYLGKSISVHSFLQK